MLWQIGLAACGAACFLYYGVICACLHKWDSTFSRFWPAAGLLFLLLAALFRWTDLDGILAGLFLLAAAVFLFTEGKILSGMRKDKAGKCRYLIVLGAHVEKDQITDSLRRRLDAALEYLKTHPDTQAVLSGGQGKGEAVTEAAAMAGYLQQRGIREERLFQEDRSTTTEENLKFSRAFLADPEAAVGIVSNNFHLYRACAMARRLGYQKVFPLPAGCHPVLFPNYMVRECFAVWKSWIRLILSKI